MRTDHTAVKGKGKRGGRTRNVTLLKRTSELEPLPKGGLFVGICGMRGGRGRQVGGVKKKNSDRKALQARFSQQEVPIRKKSACPIDLGKLG